MEINIKKEERINWKINKIFYSLENKKTERAMLTAYDKIRLLVCDLLEMGYYAEVSLYTDSSSNATLQVSTIKTQAKKYKDESIIRL